MLENKPCIDKQIHNSFESVLNFIEKSKTEKKFKPCQLECEGTLIDLSDKMVDPIHPSNSNETSNTFGYWPWSSCHQCSIKDHEIQIQKITFQEQLRLLNHELLILKDKCTVLTQEKENLCEEVEQLSRDLFEEANRMVAEERRHSEQMRKANGELLFKLEKYLK